MLLWLVDFFCVAVEYNCYAVMCCCFDCMMMNSYCCCSNSYSAQIFSHNAMLLLLFVCSMNLTIAMLVVGLFEFQLILSLEMMFECYAVCWLLLMNLKFEACLAVKTLGF